MPNHRDSKDATGRLTAKGVVGPPSVAIKFNLLLTRFGVLVTDFGDLSPVCQANYPWLVAAYP